MLRSLKIENQIRVLLEHKYINQFITDNGAMHSQNSRLWGYKPKVAGSSCSHYTVTDKEIKMQNWYIYMQLQVCIHTLTALLLRRPWDWHTLTSLRPKI